MIIKYVLNSDGTIPDYVDSGGVFTDPDDASETIVGKAVASGIPSGTVSTTVEITKDELITRMEDIMSRHLFVEDEGTNRHTFTATEFVTSWCNHVGE